MLPSPGTTHLFFLIYIYLCCVCTTSKQGDQEPTCRSWFSPSALCVPGIQLVVRLAATTFDQQALRFCLRKGSCFISLFQCRGFGHEHARPPQPVPETQAVFNSTKCTTWDFFFLILSMYVWDKCNLEMRHAKRLLTGQTVQFHWKRACPALIKALGSYPID